MRDPMRHLLLGAALLTAAPVAAQPVPTAPVDAAAVTAFWSAAGDTTLARLVDDALRANPDVRGAQARLLAARAERRQTALALGPIVTTSSGYTRRRFNSAQAFGAPVAPPEQGVWDAGFDATWELDLFGRLRPQLAARTALAGSAQEDVRGVQVTLAAEVARLYFDLQGAARQLDVARRNAANQRRTLQLTEDRLSAGRGTAFDRERASAQLSGTLALVPTLETRVADAAFALDALLGRAGATADLGAAREEEAGTGGPEPASLPEPPPADALAGLAGARPDVRAAERRLAARTALVRSARAEYRPRVGVGGTVGYSSLAVDAFGRAGTARYAVGPVVSWPAFDLGRVRARVDAARAESEDARAEYDRTLLVARAEAQAARVALERARARLAHLRDAARASERGADLARLRFEGGAAGFLEVLDAQRSLLEAQDRLAQGETEATTAFAALYKALGGAWPR
jgi:NodT family efflux transporter outer membrane factor (OMF) lipoprotein